VRIVVPDLGLSNLWSARRALETLGHEVVIAAEPGPVGRAKMVVLPGVGAFAEASRRLASTGIGDAVREAAARGAGILGICLGMQLLFESSEEGGDARGLALLAGRVTRLGGRARIPHVGWNRIEPTARGMALFGNGASAGRYLYFVHSYAARPASEDLVLARCRHGETFPAAVGGGRCVGFQFHPEKSGEAGVRLLGAAIASLAGEGR
jgi:glutamine amidotransferase